MATTSPQSGPGKAGVWIAEHFMLASVGGFILVLLAGYLVLFNPALKSLKQANRAQLLAEEKAAKAEHLAALDELEANYKSIPEEDVKRITAMIPSEEDFPGLMAVLEALSLSADVNLPGMNFSKGAASADGSAPAGEVTSIDGVLPISISLNVENANYERFKLFLELLEKHLRLFDVLRVSLNPSSAQYTLQMQTYVFTKPIN
jgi:Tfp pilus assembly protein PilO